LGHSGFRPPSDFQAAIQRHVTADAYLRRAPRTPRRPTASDEQARLSRRRRDRSDVGLVLIDTLRRVSGGANENTSEMGVVVDDVTRIREATYGGSVLVIAHTDKQDNDTRGASLLEDDSDIVWHSKANGPKANGIGPVKLVNRKMKNGAEHPDIAMTPQVVVGASGKESLVMHAADPFDTAAAELPSNDADILAVIKELFPDGATAAQIRRTVAERRGEARMGESSFYKAANRLIGQKRLRKDRYPVPAPRGGLMTVEDDLGIGPTMERCDLRFSTALHGAWKIEQGRTP
jgi:hypothetical protein